MKGSLLFSSYPFITSEKATLTRVTDMDLEALWQILSDEDSHRFTPEAALRSHRECAAKLRQFVYQLYNAHALFVLFVKGCTYTDFLCRIYVGNGVFDIFIGEDQLNIMPVRGKVK